MSDKRVERSIKSISALQNLLKDVFAKPESFTNDVLLRDALKSQGSLAKYNNAELHIIPTSINTIKRVSVEVIDGGFKALDEFRKSALERIDEYESREKSSNKRTRNGLAKRVEELEKDILVLKQSNYFLTQALYEVASDIKSVASFEDKAVRTQRSQEAIRKLNAVMSLKHMNYLLDPDHSNVVHLIR